MVLNRLCTRHCSPICPIRTIGEPKDPAISTRYLLEICSQIAVDSKNYLFLYLEVSPDAAAGLIPIELKKSRRDKIDIEFELKERSSSVGKHMGFDASDLIYLMMPKIG